MPVYEEESHEAPIQGNTLSPAGLEVPGILIQHTASHYERLPCIFEQENVPEKELLELEGKETVLGSYTCLIPSDKDEIPEDIEQSNSISRQSSYEILVIPSKSTSEENRNQDVTLIHIIDDVPVCVSRTSSNTELGLKPAQSERITITARAIVKISLGKAAKDLGYTNKDIEQAIGISLDEEISIEDNAFESSVEYSPEIVENAKNLVKSALLKAAGHLGYNVKEIENAFNLAEEGSSDGKYADLASRVTKTAILKAALSLGYSESDVRATFCLDSPTPTNQNTILSSIDLNVTKSSFDTFAEKITFDAIKEAAVNQGFDNEIADEVFVKATSSRIESLCNMPSNRSILTVSTEPYDDPHVVVTHNALRNAAINLGFSRQVVNTIIGPAKLTQSAAYLNKWSRKLALKAIEAAKQQNLSSEGVATVDHSVTQKPTAATLAEQSETSDEYLDRWAKIFTQNAIETAAMDRFGSFPESILPAFPESVLSSLTGENETSEEYLNKWAKLFTKNALELAATNVIGLINGELVNKKADVSITQLYASGSGDHIQEPSKRDEGEYLISRMSNSRMSNSTIVCSNVSLSKINRIKQEDLKKDLSHIDSDKIPAYLAMDAIFNAAIDLGFTGSQVEEAMRPRSKGTEHIKPIKARHTKSMEDIKLRAVASQLVGSIIKKAVDIVKEENVSKDIESKSVDSDKDENNVNIMKDFALKFTTVVIGSAAKRMGFEDSAIIEALKEDIICIKGSSSKIQQKQTVAFDEVGIFRHRRESLSLPRSERRESIKQRPSTPKPSVSFLDKLSEDGDEEESVEDNGVDDAKRTSIRFENITNTPITTGKRDSIAKRRRQTPYVSQMSQDKIRQKFSSDQEKKDSEQDVAGAKESTANNLDQEKRNFNVVKQRRATPFISPEDHKRIMAETRHHDYDNIQEEDEEEEEEEEGDDEKLRRKEISSQSIANQNVRSDREANRALAEQKSGSNSSVQFSEVQGSRVFNEKIDRASPLEDSIHADLDDSIASIASYDSRGNRKERRPTPYFPKSVQETLNKELKDKLFGSGSKNKIEEVNEFDAQNTDDEESSQSQFNIEKNWSEQFVKKISKVLDDTTSMHETYNGVISQVVVAENKTKSVLKFYDDIQQHVFALIDEKLGILSVESNSVALEKKRDSNNQFSPQPPAGSRPSSSRSRRRASVISVASPTESPTVDRILTLSPRQSAELHTRSISVSKIELKSKSNCSLPPLSPRLSYLVGAVDEPEMQSFSKSLSMTSTSLPEISSASVSRRASEKSATKSRGNSAHETRVLSPLSLPPIESSLSSTIKTTDDLANDKNKTNNIATSSKVVDDDEPETVVKTPSKFLNDETITIKAKRVQEDVKSTRSMQLSKTTTSDAKFIGERASRRLSEKTSKFSERKSQQGNFSNHRDPNQLVGRSKTAMERLEDFKTKSAVNSYTDDRAGQKVFSAKASFKDNNSSEKSAVIVKTAIKRSMTSKSSLVQSFETKANSGTIKSEKDTLKTKSNITSFQSNDELHRAKSPASLPNERQRVKSIKSGQENSSSSLELNSSRSLKYTDSKARKRASSTLITSKLSVSKTDKTPSSVSRASLTESETYEKAQVAKNSNDSKSNVSTTFSSADSKARVFNNAEISKTSFEKLLGSRGLSSTGSKENSNNLEKVSSERISSAVTNLSKKRLTTATSSNSEAFKTIDSNSNVKNSSKAKIGTSILESSTSANSATTVSQSGINKGSAAVSQSGINKCSAAVSQSGINKSSAAVSQSGINKSQAAVSQSGINKSSLEMRKKKSNVKTKHRKSSVKVFDRLTSNANVRKDSKEKLHSSVTSTTPTPTKKKVESKSTILSNASNVSSTVIDQQHLTEYVTPFNLEEQQEESDFVQEVSISENILSTRQSGSWTLVNISKSKSNHTAPVEDTTDTEILDNSVVRTTYKKLSRSQDKNEGKVVSAEEAQEIENINNVKPYTKMNNLVLSIDQEETALDSKDDIPARNQLQAEVKTSLVDDLQTENRCEVQKKESSETNENLQYANPSKTFTPSPPSSEKKESMIVSNSLRALRSKVSLKGSIIRSKSLGSSSRVMPTTKDKLSAGRRFSSTIHEKAPYETIPLPGNGVGSGLYEQPSGQSKVIYATRSSQRNSTLPTNRSSMWNPSSSLPLVGQVSDQIPRHKSITMAKPVSLHETSPRSLESGQILVAEAEPVGKFNVSKSNHSITRVVGSKVEIKSNTNTSKNLINREKIVVDDVVITDSGLKEADIEGTVSNA